jgi:hypothetical protein
MATKTKAVKTKPVEAKDVDEIDVSKLREEPVEAAIVPAQGNAVAAPIEASSELAERMEEAVEALSSFDDIKLPIIRLTNDGFELREGEEPINEFTGIIVYTKQSNVFFEGKYKPGENKLPRCASFDGRLPNVDDPISTDCASCPYNQFDSDPAGGGGKRCKNTRPTFILVDNPDVPDSLSIMPKVLRISPTSLALVRNYITNLAADYNSFFSVRTRFSVFKKDDAQPYYNIKFNVVKRLNAQEKANVELVRSKWLTYMQQGHFGLDDIDVTPQETAKPEIQDVANGDVEF